MMPPTSIDGTDITGATIDGTDVTEITVDGQTVFTALSLPQADLDHDYNVASLSLSDGDEISTFPDDSGNGNDLTAHATGPTFKTNVKNGQPVARVTGDQYLSGPSDLTQPFTVFIVVKANTSDLQGLYGAGGANADGRIQNSRWSVQNDIFGDPVDTTSFEIIMFEHNTSNSQIRQNDVQTATGTVVNQDYSSDDLNVFGWDNNVPFDDGDIGRYVIYDRALSSTEITEVFDVLNNQFDVY